MNRKRSWFYAALVVAVALMIAVSCAPQSVEVEKLVTQVVVVKEEVTVVVEGTPQIQEVEIEKVVTVTPSAPDEMMRSPTLIRVLACQMIFRRFRTPSMRF